MAVEAMERTGTVLVTDADRGSAVAIIRSLGRRGWTVIAADSRRRSIGFSSRYARERLVYPDPATAAHEFVEAIHRTVTERGVHLVIPVLDEVIHPLAHARQRFDGVCQLAIPDAASLERTTDKAETLGLARNLGVPVPPTRIVVTLEEAEEAAKTLRWPLVLKPAVSRPFDPGRGVVEKCPVTYASRREELIERLRPYLGRHMVLVQEYCPGVGHGVEFLAYRGRPIAVFQHRRLAEIPLTGGASAWRESVPLDPELHRHAARLVEALRWTGLIMVEFKVGDEPRLMEINGRIWGSLPLAVHSGVDFPALLAELYCGEAPPPGDEPLVDYRVGVRAHNLELLLSWIVQVLIGRRKYPFLEIPRRRQAWPALLGLLSPRQKGDIGCQGDFRPALAELLKIVRRIGRVVRREEAGTGRSRDVKGA